MKSPIVATEFVGTSVSTTGDGSDIPPALKAIVEENESVRFCNDQRGYVRCEVEKGHMRTDYRVLDYVTRPGSPIKTRASFVVENGKAGAQKA